MYATGVSSVLIDLSSLANQNDNEATLFKNLSTLLEDIGDIPVGIYESKLPYSRVFSANLLKSVSSLGNVWYYIDSSASLQETKVTSIYRIPSNFLFLTF